LKKCISILLIIFLLINTGGFIVIFYQAQYFARNQMFRSLREGDYAADEVVRFKLSSDHLNKNGDGFLWKDSHEFEYKGQMYDIIKMVEDNNQVIIYCLNDISEAKIKAAFNDELNDLANGKLNNPRYRTSLLNLISHALCLNLFQLHCPAERQKFTAELRLNLLHYIKEIPFPPPRTS
jgi:hypothetical protein